MTTATATANGRLSQEQKELIKRTVAQGATDDELALYLHDCERRGVHPLDKLLHFTKRGGRYTPITSIDLFRSRAASSGHHAGTDDAVFVEGKPYPVSATVTVYRLTAGVRCPYTATARWAEYFPGEQQGHMWKKMPYTMLAKCAEALALRKGFPQELGGLYISEELYEERHEQPIPAQAEQKPSPAIESHSKQKQSNPEPTPVSKESQAPGDPEGGIIDFDGRLAKAGFCAQGAFVAHCARELGGRYGEDLAQWPQSAAYEAQGMRHDFGCQCVSELMTRKGETMNRVLEFLEVRRDGKVTALRDLDWKQLFAVVKALHEMPDVAEKK